MAERLLDVLLLITVLGLLVGAVVMTNEFMRESRFKSKRAKAVGAILFFLFALLAGLAGLSR